MRFFSNYYRWLKYGIGLSVVGGSIVNLKHSNWDIRSTGAVRFGRAAVAVRSTAFNFNKFVELTLNSVNYMALL